MSKEYARKTPREYSLSKSLYMRVLHTVRDYPRMKQDISDVLFCGSSLPYTEYIEKGKVCRAVMPSAHTLSDQTQNKAFKIMQTLETLESIDKALKKVPQEYRKSVFDNVVYKKPYPYFADKSTWSRWRIRFLYYVAQELGWL